MTSSRIAQAKLTASSGLLPYSRQGRSDFGLVDLDFNGNSNSEFQKSLHLTLTLLDFFTTDITRTLTLLEFFNTKVTQTWAGIDENAKVRTKVTLMNRLLEIVPMTAFLSCLEKGAVTFCH